MIARAATFTYHAPSPFKSLHTVKRDTLLKKLENIVNEDELHLLSILTNKPTIKVKVNKDYGETFETNLGIMLGDCLSAVLFIFYLAECFNEDCDNNKPLKYDLTSTSKDTFNVDPLDQLPSVPSVR